MSCIKIPEDRSSSIPIEMARGIPCTVPPAGGYTAVDLEQYIHPQWGHRRVVGYESAAAAHTAVLFVPLGGV